MRKYAGTSVTIFRRAKIRAGADATSAIVFFVTIAKSLLRGTFMKTTQSGAEEERNEEEVQAQVFV
ncbi:MAG: hypothetical protein Q7R73_01870 [bacterium]|nr:hypothetical protein [bacterium]